MRVELDIYSGRPNPSWVLTAEEATELLRRLQALPESDSGSVREGLGYRGLVVTGEGLRASALDKLEISAGIAVGRGSGPARLFQDRERDLERWLCSTGKGKIDDLLYDGVSEDLDRHE